MGINNVNVNVENNMVNVNDYNEDDIKNKSNDNSMVIIVIIQKLMIIISNKNKMISQK